MRAVVMSPRTLLSNARAVRGNLKRTLPVTSASLCSLCTFQICESDGPPAFQGLPFLQ